MSPAGYSGTPLPRKLGIKPGMTVGALAPDAKLWIAWPKQGSPLAADINRDGVRAFGLERGWVDFKVCAIDDTWSGLCFSRRRG